MDTKLKNAVITGHTDEWLSENSAVANLLDGTGLLSEFRRVEATIAATVPEAERTRAATEGVTAPQYAALIRAALDTLERVTQLAAGRAVLTDVLNDYGWKQGQAWPLPARFTTTEGLIDLGRISIRRGPHIAKSVALGAAVV